MLLYGNFELIQADKIYPIEKSKSGNRPDQGRDHPVSVVPAQAAAAVV